MSDTGEQKARTLSGIPRVEGVAPETPQQDIRNAMAIIANLHTIAPAMAGGVAYEFPVQDRLAVMRRLALAVRKLESR